MSADDFEDARIETMTGDALAAQVECVAILAHVDEKLDEYRRHGDCHEAVRVLEGLRRWLHVRIEER